MKEIGDVLSVNKFFKSYLKYYKVKCEIFGEYN